MQRTAFLVHPCPSRERVFIRHRRVFYNKQDRGEPSYKRRAFIQEESLHTRGEPSYIIGVFIHHRSLHTAASVPSSLPCTASMGFFTLQPTMVTIILSGLLSITSVTPHKAGSDGIPQASVKIDNSVILHSLTITGLSSKDTEENIILDSPVHLKLECILKADSMQISNLTWIHGEEEINKDLYSENNTAGEWRTTLEVSVADVNSTGSYACIFSSTTEAKATFYIKAPGVHSGGKTLVTYNGDSTVLKCDSFKYKPVEWLWYKVNENEQVLLTMSSESSRFKQDNKTANETKLHLSGLTEGDSGTYVCKAVFKTGESEGQVEVNVLSLMVPFKVFLAIVAEVAVLVGIILGYELLSKRKHSEDDVKSEDEQMTQLKSEENGKSEESTTRQRKA